MTVRFPDAVREDRADVINARAGTGALIRIYSGTQPATADTTASGTLLAELTVSGAFGTVSSEGVLTVGAVTQDSSANATGTAGWFRVVASNGTTVVIDGSVTATGGGGQLQLNSLAIVATEPVEVDSFVITEGGA